VRIKRTTHSPFFKLLEIASPLGGFPIAVQTHAREGVAGFGGSSPVEGEISLHVVAVEFGSAEDDRLLHLVLPDGADTILACDVTSRASY